MRWRGDGANGQLTAAAMPTPVGAFEGKGVPLIEGKNCEGLAEQLSIPGVLQHLLSATGEGNASAPFPNPAIQRVIATNQNGRPLASR
jgi:hypothetical protein